ncbi:MAG: TNT domain-containing protein, partial [Anaerolineae bacterium]|nr:TNT domain-containing protein [Anaerolineae bacterium]
FLMKDPELLGDILYQQVAAAAPQLTAQAAGAATDVLISGAGWALGMVREAAGQRIGGAGSKMLPAPPPGSVNPWEGPIESTVLQQDTVMYRIWGGKSGKVGTWLTPTRPESATNARSSLALWSGNTAEFVTEVTVPAGTRVQIGRAASAFGQPGGALQVQLLVEPDPSWFGPSTPLR